MVLGKEENVDIFHSSGKFSLGQFRPAGNVAELDVDGRASVNPLPSPPQGLVKPATRLAQLGGLPGGQTH
eukprot:4451534-Pyramimonas_sp.AAC.1